jgi:DNA-binding transcriptional ArsR family regulator
VADGASGANVDAALDALGHPTRRRVLELLRAGELTVAGITREVPVSQSAVSQHLRVLAGAGLVVSRPSGTRRYYRVAPGGLVAVRAYVDTFWDGVLDAFTAYAEENP